MIKQMIFTLVLLLTLGIFMYSLNRIFRYFKWTQPAFAIRNHGKRIKLMFRVVFAQSKIFRWPFPGLLHALVFWGFLVITIGSIEMVLDGLLGTERILGAWGGVYDVIIAAGDVFGLIVLVAIAVFLARRLLLKVSRFQGREIKKRSKQDANLALTIIALLMISLLGMNAAYSELHTASGQAGVYPVGAWLAGQLLAGASASTLHLVHEASWWSHILLIFLFANVLPYSKHFHVFTSLPNVYLSTLQPKGYLTNMDEVTNEVRMMLNPEAGDAAPAEDEQPERFGVLDAEDTTWKNYLDALSCTQCGRCTAVCPASQTGKKLSPRKVVIDLRARMKEKGPGLIKEGKGYDDSKHLLRNFTTEEELWACTTCNACVQECPLNINHVSLIVSMRRYLAMEEASAPAAINTMFTNIENNGAPWQYPPEDRTKWMEEL